MKTFAIDIETAPLLDAEDRIHQYYPFDPSKVAIGNRGPEKAAEYIEEKRLSHVSDILDKAALDPALSYICAIGIMEVEETGKAGTVDVTLAMDPDEERDLLMETFSRLVDRTTFTRWVGWNLTGFDMEFIFRRGWINKLTVVPHHLRKGRYWNNEHLIDLMQEWAFYNNRNSWDSLDRVAKILGVQSPNRPEGVTGKDFARLLHEDRDTALKYLTADLQETKRIAQIILPFHS